MFEIGPALREARERQQLSYSQVEEGTKIRSRYIRALEEEDFAVLPGPTYTKGFLRAYADYLGLDGHLFIDEFNSRHHDPRVEPEREIYPRTQARQQHRHRRESSIVLIALAAIVLIAMLVFLAAKSPDNTAQLPLPPATNPSTGTGGASGDSGGKSDLSSSATTPKKHTKQQAAKPKKFTVVISAAGDSYVTTHVGSMTGPAAVTEKGTTLDNYLLQAGIDATVKSAKPRLRRVRRPGQHQRHHDQRQDRADALHRLGPGHEDHGHRHHGCVTAPSAAILLTGNELLRGVISDRNASFLAADLELRGVRVRRTLVVGDDVEDIAGGLRELAGVGRPGRHVRRPRPDPRRPHGRGHRRASPASAWCSTRGCWTPSPAGRTRSRPGRGSIPRCSSRATASRRTSPRAHRCWASRARRRGWSPRWRGASVVVLPGVPSELRRLWLDAPAHPG